MRNTSMSCGTRTIRAVSVLRHGFVKQKIDSRIFVYNGGVVSAPEYSRVSRTPCYIIYHKNLTCQRRDGCIFTGETIQEGRL